MDADSRENFVILKKRAHQLAKQCRKNLANENTGLWLTSDELKGLPTSFISRLVQG